MIDLWYFFYEKAAGQHLPGAYEALLSPDERERCDRFHFERDRSMYIAAHALVRTVLSQYAAIAPANWRFAADEHGKPSIVQPHQPSLHFNLSHTHGLAACAVSLKYQRIGVDVEYMDHARNTAGIADSCFSPTENRALSSLPPVHQNQRFFQYWTLKESYIKARGEGLALPLQEFSFLLEDGQPIRIAFDAGFADDAARWRFASLTPGPSHMMAVSADTGGADLELRTREYVPMAGAVAAA